MLSRLSWIDLLGLSLSSLLFSGCLYLALQEKPCEPVVVTLDSDTFFADGADGGCEIEPSPQANDLLQKTQSSSLIKIASHYGSPSDASHDLAIERGRALALWLIEQGVDPGKLELALYFFNQEKNSLKLTFCHKPCISRA